jgi:Ca-activated chloride channel family protein
MFFDYKALHPIRLLSHGVRSLRYARPASLLLSSLLLLAVYNASTFAQDTEAPDEVVRVSTDLIIVPFFVTDGRGHRVVGLTEKDFVVRDNGREVSTSYFASGAERVALVFALDASGSARDIIQGQRETALALFSRFGRGSRVSVLRFTERADLAASFTADTNEALAAFNFPASRGQRTAIFDAALEAVRAFNARVATERRIVIMISDGLDTASTVNPSQVINEARAGNVSFYVIHLPLFAPREGRLAVRPASKGFRELAEKTGGNYFMLGDAKSALAARTSYDLAPVFSAIEDDLRGQYILGYYPGEGARDGRTHRIEVGLASNSNRKLRVQTLRKEYILKNAQ